MRCCSVPEELALVGFLAGYSGLTHDAYALDLRQDVAWCTERDIALFGPRRADIESFGRYLEALGLVRATISRRLCTIATFYRTKNRGQRCAPALGVIAITTLEGAARFCIWDDDSTQLAPAQHRDDTAHQWDTDDGDLVILRCEAWPSAQAHSPVHEARSPHTGARRTLTLRHNGNGYGADYFA